jgi:phage host-nuclease inhibitor protein Gam
MKRTTRQVVPTAPTTEEMQQAMLAYADAYVQRLKLESFTAAKIEAAKQLTADRIASYSKELDANTDILQRWAQANPEQFLRTQKIDVYGGHKIGWQDGPPSATITGTDKETKQRRSWKWFLKKCMELGLEKWIRRTPEVDKEAMLAAAEAKDKEALAQLTELGVTVGKSKHFVIDLAV